MMHTCSHTPTTLCVVIAKPFFDVDFDSQQEEQGSLKITSVYHLPFFFFYLKKKSVSPQLAAVCVHTGTTWKTVGVRLQKQTKPPQSDYSLCANT